MLRIGKLCIQYTQGQARLCAEIALNGRGTTLWFGVEEGQGAYLCPERGDAFVMALLPMAFSWCSRNSLPMVNAMKPRAVCVMMLMPSTCSRELKPRPGRFRAPRQKGPSRRPATRYAVTAGRCSSFVTRENISPPTSATARQMR